jgi:hypothetical protein
VMQNAVKYCAGNDLVAEDVAPVGKEHTRGTLLAIFLISSIAK